jgi:hypothetical protein
MTLEEFAIKHLTDNGMFDAQAKQVIESVKSAKENEAMQGRWNDDSEGYPSSMMGVLIYTVNNHAVEYIDKNCPKAWFRPIFAGGVPA